MSNFKHYINGLMSGNSFFTTKLIMRTSLYSFGFIHILNAILMLVAGLRVPFVINILLAVWYIAYLPVYVKNDHYVYTLVATLVALILACGAFSVLLGYRCGFSMYLYASIPAIFYYSFVIDNVSYKNSLAFILCSLCCISFLAIYVTGFIFTPVYTLPSTKWIHTFYIMNLILSFLIMIVYSYLFVWQLRSKQRVMEEQNVKLEELAHRDPLTHLYNRRYMGKILDGHMEAQKDRGARFSLVLGDIDDFKKVNDTYGHDAGDLVLVTVAETIERNVGPNDYVCRWGGEEILILISVPLEPAAKNAERIRRALEENTVMFGDQEIHVTMTFGVSESIPGYKIEHLIQQADDKLYYGKHRGKNCVVSTLPPG